MAMTAEGYELLDEYVVSLFLKQIVKALQVFPSQSS